MDKKKLKKNTIIAAVLLFVALLLYTTKDSVVQFYHDLFDTRTEVGHVMLSELAKTEKLTVLSMYKEVVVSQYKEESSLLFGTKVHQIHSVFPGRIDVGFDLTQVSDDWLLMREDTAYVKLPAVQILNQGDWYLDEAAHQTPIEEGEWTNEDYVRMSHRANALLKRNCELDNCYTMAEENGRRVVRNLLQAIGIKYVNVEVTPRDSYKPFTINMNGTDRKGVHYDFYIAADGSRYVKFEDGATLFYQGDFDDGDLYSIIDMFSYYTQGKASRQWKISLQGQRLTIDMVNLNLTKGSQAADAFSRSRRKTDVERLSAALHQLMGADLQLIMNEVDRRGQQLYRY
ncbi:MAG: DUF4230 domain-containing protein [Prevotella sp.]|nr:DUF4230 domain-containing protein [Prevotella sp.]